MLTVLFPGKATWYEKAVEEGTLRVKQDSLFFAGARDLRLRGKTCNPEKMAQYIAAYLNKIAKSVPPNYTHSKPPIT